MKVKNSNFFTKVSLLIFGIALLAAMPLAKFLVFAFAPFQANSKESAIIEIHRGLSPNEVTKSLASKGIISSGRNFLWLGRLTRQWGHIKAGEYQISSAMSPMQIFSRLSSGISVAYPVTIREGENLYEIGQSLAEKKLVNSADEFIQLCFDQPFITSFQNFKDNPPRSLEGFLFPDTYYFSRKIHKEEIARQMVHHFFDYWTASQTARAKTLGLTVSAVVTLASMIEKETGASEERPLISSVFYNRLEKKMRLQSDPTTIYGIWQKYRGNLQKADLFEKNEYNTYQIPALPIGPIANPGREALQAALYPSKSPFLYFVSHNDGTHEFTSTYQDHLAAVRKFQLDPKAKEGKSWRDLARKQHPKKS